MKGVIIIRRRTFFLSLLLVLTLINPAHAEARIGGVIPSLSFDGTTATCEATIRGNKFDDEICAVMNLWQGSYCVETWEKSETTLLVFDCKASVEAGKYYTLTLEYSINGKAYPEISTSKFCG